MPLTDLQPTRRGFGRELIEQGLPYELGAVTAMEFRPGGLRCTVGLMLSNASPSPGKRRAAQRRVAEMKPSPLEGLAILVAEDHYVVATELTRMLQQLGATVVGPVARLPLDPDLAGTTIHLALLDVELCNGTSFPLADKLALRGIPVALDHRLCARGIARALPHPAAPRETGGARQADRVRAETGRTGCRGGRVNRLYATFGNSRSDNAAVLRFGGMAKLSTVEVDVLRELSQAARHYPAQAELCVEGRVQLPMVLLAGWACHQRILGDGRRQIVRFLLAGDAIGSLCHPSLPATSAALALTPVVAADARTLTRAADESGALLPGLADAMALMSHADATIMRDQVVRLGRQTAYERLVHLILELHHRLDAIGMVDGDSFALPLTQEILADALGLSVVHINRTLQQVRRDRLLDMRGGQVTLRQIDLMRAMADWVTPGG